LSEYSSQRLLSPPLENTFASSGEVGFVDYGSENRSVEALAVPQCEIRWNGNCADLIEQRRFGLLRRLKHAWKFLYPVPGVRIDPDRLAGLIFLVIGVATVVLGWTYGLGSMNQPGSGAMPVLAGGALALLGTAQLLRATAMKTSPTGSAFSRTELRPLLLVLSAVFAFAVLILPTGLIPALIALIAIAWFAQKGRAGWEIVGATVVVILVIIAIFKYGLGLPLHLLVWGF